MSTRAEKALKAQKDKHHSILRELVQELPNKTCADCLAKGKWKRNALIRTFLLAIIFSLIF